jgi:hypothetical protein
MFEHKSEPLLSGREFMARLARSTAVGASLVLTSLAIGMLGYHSIEGLSWIDAFLNAAMLLGGMGPVNTPLTFGGKLFAGLYALYCGLVVIVVAGVLLAPVIHRALHKFHFTQGKL